MIKNIKIKINKTNLISYLQSTIHYQQITLEMSKTKYYT